MQPFSARARETKSMTPKVSVTLIVKNEESSLPACLASVTGLADEILVIDTGSTDRTKEVAAGLGARVLDFPWIDDFAAARNEGLKHATGKWIFWLDADERLDDANREKLRALIAGLTDENAAYVMKQRSGEGSGAATVVDQVRLFPNNRQVRWRYRVHEQILPALRQVGCDIRFTDIAIDHAGLRAGPAAPTTPNSSTSTRRSAPRPATGPAREPACGN